MTNKLEAAKDHIDDRLVETFRKSMAQVFGTDAIGDTEVEAIVALSDGAIARRIAAGLSPA